MSNIEYFYEFMVHNVEECNTDIFEKYIHANITPAIKNISESLNAIISIPCIKVRYGITSEDYINSFSLSISLFSLSNNESIILGNIYFEKGDHHKSFCLSVDEPLSQISLKGLVSIEYHINPEIKTPKRLLYNNLFFEYALFKNLFSVFNMIENHNCLEGENGINYLSIEFLYTTEYSYWQICKTEERKKYYSIPRNMKDKTSEIDIVYALKDIDFVFKRKWFERDMLAHSIENLVKTAKLLNY